MEFGAPGEGTGDPCDMIKFGKKDGSSEVHICYKCVGVGGEDSIMAFAGNMAGPVSVGDVSVPGNVICLKRCG